MHQIPCLLLATALVTAATAACGGSATTSTTSTTRPGKPASTSQSTPAFFPLTVTRSGGVAGFRDVLVVAADGLVTVTRKGQAQRRCRLGPAAAERLTTAGSRVPWSRIASTRQSTGAFPDDLVTTVQSPAGGPVRLEDLVATGRQAFLNLLDDLSAGSAAARMCRPL